MAWEVPNEIVVRLEQQKRVAGTLPCGAVQEIHRRYHQERHDYLAEQYSPAKDGSTAQWCRVDAECRQKLNDSMEAERWEIEEQVDGAGNKPMLDRYWELLKEF